MNSGAITIGSMLTPIVFSADSANVYHIKKNVDQRISSLKKELQQDKIFENCLNRICVTKDKNYIDGNMYMLTSDWSSIEQQIGSEDECVLHIDMDFFNNRYNGSTSWRTDELNHDSPMDDQKGKWMRFVQA